MRTTENDMLSLLADRYASKGSKGVPQYIFATQVLLFDKDYQARRIDALAIDGFLHQRKKHIHGFEVKVSRADWLSEYKQKGKKSELWMNRTTHFWLVIPDKNIIKMEELPETWGLLVGTKKLRKIKDPIYRDIIEEITLKEIENIARKSHKDMHKYSKYWN